MDTAVASSDISKVGGRPRRRRWRRVVGLFILFLIVLLAVMAWQAPRLAGTGPGMTFISKVINGSQSAVTVGFSSLDLSWSETQQITGLRVVNRQTGDTADLDVHAQGSLLAWARGNRDFGTVEISGNASLTEVPESSGSGPVNVPAGLSVEVLIKGFTLNLARAALTPNGSAVSASVTIDDGAIDLRTGQPLEVALAGSSRIGTEPGSFSVRMSLPDMIGADGVLHLEQLNGEIAARATNLPCAVIEQLAGQPGRIVPAVGASATVDCSWQGSPERGTGAVRLESELAHVDLTFEVANGHVRVQSPTTIKWTATPSVIGNLSAPVPVDVNIATLDAKLPTSGYGFNVSGAKLNVQISAATRFAVTMPSEATSSATEAWIVDGLHVAVNTDDPVSQISINATANVGQADTQSRSLSPVAADLSLQRLLTARGRVSLDTLGIGGSITGRRIPTAMLDRLAGLEGWAVDAVGRSVDEVEVTAAVDAGAAEQLAAGEKPDGRRVDLASLPRTTFVVRARSQSMTLVADGVLEKGTLSIGQGTDAGRIEIRPTEALLHRAMTNPALADSLPPDFRLNQVSSINVLLGRFTMPLSADDPVAMLERAAWQADVQIADVKMQYGSADSARAVTIDSLIVKSSSDQMSGSILVDADGTMRIDGSAAAAARFALQSEVISPLDASQRTIEMTAVVDRMPVTLADLAGVTVQGMPLGELAGESLGRTLDVEAQARIVPVEESLGLASLSARIQGKERFAEIALTPGSTTDRPTLTARGSIRALVTPAMCDRLMSPAMAAESAEGTAATRPMTLTDPATVLLTLQQTAVPSELVATSTAGNGAAAIPFSRLADRQWLAAALQASGTIDRIALADVPGLAQPIVVQGLTFDVSAPNGVRANANLVAGGQVLTAKADPGAVATPAGRVRVNAQTRPGNDGTLTLGATVECIGVELDAVEGLLGWSNRLLPTTLGSVGDVSAQLESAVLPNPLNAGDARPAFSTARMFEPATVRITTALPRLSGNLLIRQPETGMVNVSASHLNYSVDSELVEGFLNGTSLRSSDARALGDAAAEVLRQSGAEGARLANRWQHNTQQAWTMVNTKSLLDITINRLDVPLDVLLGRSLDLSLVSAGGSIGVNEVVLARGDARTAFRNMNLTVGGTNAAEGLTLNLSGAPTVTTAGGAEPAQPAMSSNGIALTGVLHALNGDMSVPAVDLKGGMNGLPVGVVDSMLNLGGRLEAAFGDTMNVQLDTADLSRHTGSGSLTLTSPNGTIHMPKLAWDGASVTAMAPVTGQLAVTSAFSDSVLSQVHPALTSASKADGTTPLAFNVRSMTVPVNGDLSLLGGEIDLNLGQLQLARGGLLSDLLGTLADTPEIQTGDTAAAVVPPVAVNIRNGLLHYDQLDITSDLFTISSKGTVDLVKRQLNLSVRVPLLGWRRQFSQMTKTPMARLAGASMTDIPFYLTVTGPLDNPKVQPDPNGVQKVADEFFKNMLQDTVQGVLGDILGGGNKKKDGKNK